MPRYLGWGWLPLCATLAWSATILTLLILWTANGTPHYKQDDADIVYISDVGAKYKAFFIVGTATTAVFFILTLITEYRLRRAERLVTFHHPRAKFDSILALLFGAISGIALTMLAVFDANNHSTVHWILTLIFIFALGVSAAFTVGELKRLCRIANGGANGAVGVEAGYGASPSSTITPYNPHFAHQLRRSFIIKTVIVVLAFLGIIAMIVLMSVCRNNTTTGRPITAKCNTSHSAAAVVEWALAVLAAVYFATLVWDLRQAVLTSTKGVARPGTQMGDQRGSVATLQP
ncbi:Frag1/DRAM/Sfk1 [Fimicolochytrium jonesii]|uniref:Frag1/DRAM/Sfk1 n=1 Tax=Fimicolochytrium jonesii TaxID=1396493 RepID=UPI0022FEBAAA|nr:Frag1/DRAM/Sfk1 [Fimicolochytrium jonesii]KAI8822468.1 Frag1/DRAM/Sfk1 [Fimicolochytrium jonesii]